MGFFDKIKSVFKKHGDDCGCCGKKEKAPKTMVAVKTAPAAWVNPLDAFPLQPGTPPGGKIKLAIYWAAGCGGCDVSLLDMDERILTIGDMADIVLWPIATDGKEHDIAEMKDGEITISIINGAVRNTENDHMVKLLRQKSQFVVSYGTCACSGGSPALANLVPGGKDEILDYVYRQCTSMKDFQDKHKKPIIPQASVKTADGVITLPEMFNVVKSLDQVIDVDYFVPGCPPTKETISQLIAAVASHVYNGVALPPKGTMIGASAKSLCEECPRKKELRRITKIVEPHEIDVDPELCLMDQGILCLGPATAGGCGSRCTRAAQPCRGCYGPTKLVDEMGASMFTAVASLFPVMDFDPICGEDRIMDIMASVKDPLGYFYAFSMSKSLIKRSVIDKKGGQ